MPRTSWNDDVEARLVEAFEPLADPEQAVAVRAYMKDVAPFLGIKSGPRRQAQRTALQGVATPTEAELTALCRSLWGRGPRDYQYAAIEILGKYLRVMPPGSLDGLVRDLLTDTPWWDTVDALGSAAVTPLVVRHPELVEVMWEWNADENLWLIRASIQHQRGRGHATDVPRLIAMADAHAVDRRFFVAKAIGWALRDLTRIDPAAVEAFLAAHPDLPGVAKREAVRGLARLER